MEEAAWVSQFLNNSYLYLSDAGGQLAILEMPVICNWGATNHKGTIPFSTLLILYWFI